MTRVLITGMAGFVGSHLAEYLLEKTDWNVYGLVRWNEPLDNLSGILARINEGDRVELREGDLTDIHSMMKVVREVSPDYVFHLAAQSYVQASFTSPIWTLQTNVIGTANLLEAIRSYTPTAWVHNCSSSEVYGKVPLGKSTIDEDCPLEASSPYSASKIGADVLGRLYANAYGLRVLTTRMFTHTGPRRGDIFAESSFAKQIAMIAAGQLSPPLKVGNLASIRTIADVRDAVRAYHLLLTTNPIAGEVYNIGGAHTCTVGDMLQALLWAADLHYDIEVDNARLRPLDADNQVPNCTKFMKHTGWRPEISFTKTIVDLMEYWHDRVRKGVQLQR